MADNNILLEVYKTHSSHSNSITASRNTMNAVFITIHSLYLSFAVNQFPLFTIFGLLLCFIWLRQLKSLQILNKSKIEILSNIEKQIGFDFYDKEQELCKKYHQYKTITSNDRYLVWIFILSYVLFILYRIYLYLHQSQIWNCVF